MNSYERRLVHVELAIHPDVTTESIGAGKNRYVIIKPIGAEKKDRERIARDFLKSNGACCSLKRQSVNFLVVAINKEKDIIKYFHMLWRR